MSHVASVPCSFQSLAAMKAACAKLGWTFREGVTRLKWYGKFVDDSPVVDGIFDAETTAKVRAMSSGQRKSWMTEHFPLCDHVIEVPGCTYTVGVFKKDDGTWGLKWDYYQSALNVAMGGAHDGTGGAGKFQQFYTAEVWKQTAIEQGHNFSEYQTADGAIELEVEV